MKKEKKNLKTQISSLRSGTQRQILNPDIDYSGLPKSTQHKGHGGTNAHEVSKIWEKVKSENPKELDVVIMGLKLKIKAEWSVSGRSVNYITFISNEDLKEYFGLDPSRTRKAFISISGKDIIVSNGKNSYIHICPSLVEIL